MTKSRWRIEWEQGLMTLDERATDPAADDMTKAVLGVGTTLLNRNRNRKGNR